MSRAALVLLASLIFYAGELHACRPRFWAPEELAAAGNVIVLSEITSNEAGAVTLRVLKVLKGTAPQGIYTKAGEIHGWADGCRFIEDPTWTRVHEVGQKWILIGEIGREDQFVATAPAYAYQEDVPGSVDLLNQIQRYVKKSANKGTP